MTKTFILGVGAQKAGTSWLYNYVSACPDAHFGVTKEYHTWDVKYSPLCSTSTVHLKSLLLKPSRVTLVRYAMQRFDGFYEFYFKTLVRDRYNITGDITPTYTVLSAEQLHSVKDKLERSGFTVKVVFLMRDPVERCWSAVRMKRNTRSGKRLARNASRSETEELRKVYGSKRCQFRTQYELVIQNLEKVFSSDRIYLGLYEEMFSLIELQRLSEFLQVRCRREYIEQHFNVSPKANELDSALRADIMTFYASTYNFCFDRFPQTRRLWNAFEQTV